MAELQADIFIYEVEHDGECHYYVSPLPYEHGFGSGLRPEAIMGELTNGPEEVTLDHFNHSPAFLQFLARVIGKRMSEWPGLIAEVQRQQNGFVYLIDKRTLTPNDAVPPEDIIGGIEIRAGQMLRFHSNPSYRMFTENGFMHLDDWMRERLLEEIVTLSERKERK